MLPQCLFLWSEAITIKQFAKISTVIKTFVFSSIFSIFNIAENEMKSSELPNNCVKYSGREHNLGVKRIDLVEFSLGHFTETSWPGVGLCWRGRAVPDLRLSIRSSKQWVDSIFLIFTHCFVTRWT